MRRIPLTVVTLGVLAFGAIPAAAQDRNPLLVATEEGRFRIPLCELKVDGKARDGQKELRKGIEDSKPEKRAEALAKAEEILTKAVAGDDANDPAAWYHLGRTYLALGDLAGADSAFAKAERMAPDCSVDIADYRQTAWVTLANAGLEARQRGDDEEALKQFRDASRIYRERPEVFENLGIIFANAGMNDSAAVYFGHALEASVGDSLLVENRNSSALNQALMYRRLGQHEEAVGVLDRYLAWNPNDVDAKRSKANSLHQLGRVEEAQALERELVAQLATMDLDSLPTEDVMALGVSYYNESDFTSAAAAFEHALEREPWSRDVVYNLAHTLAMALGAASDSAAATDSAQVDATKQRLTEIGRRLQEIEPLNEDSYRLPAQGYRDRDQDSLVLMAEQLMALPVDIQVTQFALYPSGALWTGVATGRAATDPAGEALPTSPVTLVFEFLDGTGSVVHSEELSVPALEEGSVHELRVEGGDNTIESWRYRRK